MELCFTHHTRAQFIEQRFISLKIEYSLCSDSCKVERVLEAVSGFTNPFSSSFEDNELYFLSFGVPANPGIAKNLIEPDGIDKKAVADFIDLLLVENLSFTTP